MSPAIALTSFLTRILPGEHTVTVSAPLNSQSDHTPPESLPTSSLETPVLLLGLLVPSIGFYLNKYTPSLYTWTFIIFYPLSFFTFTFNTSNRTGLQI